MFLRQIYGRYRALKKAEQFIHFVFIFERKNCSGKTVRVNFESNASRCVVDTDSVQKRQIAGFKFVPLVLMVQGNGSKRDGLIFVVRCHFFAETGGHLIIPQLPATHQEQGDRLVRLFLLRLSGGVRVGLRDIRQHFGIVAYLLQFSIFRRAGMRSVTHQPLKHDNHNPWFREICRVPAQDSYSVVKEHLTGAPCGGGLRGHGQCVRRSIVGTNISAPTVTGRGLSR